MPRITPPRILIGLSIAALLLVAFALVRAVAPTYGSGIDDLSWEGSVSPVAPRAGDEIVVTFAPSGNESPFFTQTPRVVQDDEHPSVALIEHIDGYGAILRLRAMRPGTAIVSVSGSFEKFGCYPTPTPVPPPFPGPCFPKGFDYVTTPEIEITVATLCGDASGDNVVNSIDAAWVLQYAAGLLVTIVFPADADVNSDAYVDAVDAALVLQSGAALLPPGSLHCPPPMTP